MELTFNKNENASKAADLPGPVHAVAAIAQNVSCTLDSIRNHIKPFLPRQRPFLGLASLQQKAKSRVRTPRQVTFRNSQFAAAIPGDGVVEQVFTSGISSFLNLYNTVLIGRIILTWFPSAPPAIVQPLSTITDPYLNLFRGIIPPLGGTLDLSPILAFVALDLFTNAAAALPCELEESKSEDKEDPMHIFSPSKAALKLRNMSRRRRQTLRSPQAA